MTIITAIMFSAGTYFFLYRMRGHLIDYISLVALCLYVLTVSKFKRLSALLYIIHLIMQALVLFKLHMFIIGLVVTFITIPFYFLSERKKEKNSTFNLRLEDIHIDNVAELMTYLVIGGLIFIYVLYGSSDLYLISYDMGSAIFLSIGMYFSYKNSNIQWLFKMGYSLILLHLFYMINLDVTLVIVQLFKMIICLFCFLTAQWELEK